MAYFELTKPEKVARAAALNVDVFIDDLPEILGMAGWREGTRKILFDPENHFPDEPYERYASWEAIQHALLDA
jgi:5'(3')-deoxyribonucleotidase